MIEERLPVLWFYSSCRFQEPIPTGALTFCFRSVADVGL